MKYTHVIMDHVGGPDVLHMQEDDIPEPRKGKVRIEILATDVSFSTVLMQHGQYPGAPAVPFTAGYDLVGRVDKIGPEVSGIEHGHLVLAGKKACFIASPDSRRNIPSGFGKISPHCSICSCKGRSSR